MAVVSVSINDSTMNPRKWELPVNYLGLRSPIPIGLGHYVGTSAIATLSAGDETSVKVTLTMPTGFVFIPRTFNMAFISDDLVNNFNALGYWHYGIDRHATSGFPQGTMKSPGNVIIDAIKAMKVYVPDVQAPKELLAGGDVARFRFADMDAGGSTAGDFWYFAEFYIYNVDQIDKWEVNTPVPIFNQASF